MREKQLYNNTQIISNTKSKLSNKINRTYKGFSTVNETSKKFSLTDFELIKQDIINHFNIHKGEKLENPNFGTIIWDAIFDPMTETLKQEIISDVRTIIGYDPRVQVEYVNVIEYATGLKIECTLKYLLSDVSEQLIYKFDRGHVA
jgi:phage baseplate assembly protein W